MTALIRRRRLLSAIRLNDAPAALAGLLVGVPVLGTCIVGLFAGGGETWTHIVHTFFWTYFSQTLLLIFLTGALILVTAVPAAWLVTMYVFPGRRIFSWALILPLAAPGYVLAISYADFFGVVGPAQTWLREITGLTARDYWFPDIRSLPGCAFVLAAALNPYVYLTSRAAFMTQSVTALEAARALGVSASKRFWRVALPSARPAIAAGCALGLMEAAADYGAADFLGVQTLTVGVFRAWASYGDPAAGARLALVLVSLTLLFQWFERRQRGDAGYAKSPAGWRKLTPEPLTGIYAIVASLFCLLILGWGFLLPIGHMITVALDAHEQTPPVGDALWNSLRLAALGASGAFMVALAIGFAAHRARPVGKLARAVTTGGYAIPGAVLAVGALYALQYFGMPLTGNAALILLICVYISRFTAAGAQPMEAALGRVPAGLGYAARSLGVNRFARIRHVDLPALIPAAAASALILFVEILKELPATLMLRPFDWDTLAVRAYAYASDERLAASATPSLAIVFAGLLPVILLSSRLSTNAASKGAE